MKPAALLLLVTAGLGADELGPAPGRAASAASAPAPVEGEACAPCAREWSVRRLALDPEALLARAVELEGGEDWRALVAFFDAARRAAPLDPARSLRLEPFARARLAHPHPNVRAGALAALRAAGGWPADGEALLCDPWPAVREELARSLALAPGAAAVDALERLARDPDGRVARAALRAACGREDAAAQARALLDALERAGETEAWLGEIEELALERGHSPLLELLLSGEPPAGSALDPLARRATVAAAWLARRGCALLPQQRAPALRALAAGVDVPWSEEGEPAGVALRRDALHAAAARAVGAPLGEALLAWPSSALEDPRALPRLRAALIALGPRLLVEHASARGEAVDLGAPPWRELAGSELALGARLAPDWLQARRTDELRRAGARALASALPAGLVEAQALLRWLDDPDAEVADVLFRALCEPDDPRAWLAPLHAAWRARPREEQLHALTRLTRACALPEFRADLLALGADPSMRTRNASTIELLAAFRDDDEVRAALEQWLLEDLERLGAAGEEAPERRALELRAQGLTRALSRVGGERALDALCAALELARDDEEVAKAVVGWIARLDGGLARLEPWLSARLPERVRVEVALWLAQGCAPDAIRVLVARWEGLDGELRSRVLERFGGCPDEVGLRLLERVALGEEDLRHQALALQACTERARAGEAAALAVLVRAAEPGRPLELRRRALEGLGSAGATERLLEAWARESARVEGPADERELVREELLVALARAGGADGLVASALLARPLERAEAELERRFEARRGSATGFAWRGELEAAAALGRRGTLGPDLLAERAWWRADARLALELALVAGEAAARRQAGEGPAVLALSLARSAAVGAEGEAEAEDLSRLRAQACALAAALERGFGRLREHARWLARLEEERRAGRIELRDVELALGADLPLSEQRALLACARALVRAERAAARGDAEELARARALALELASCSPRAAALHAALAPARDGAGSR